MATSIMVYPRSEAGECEVPAYTPRRRYSGHAEESLKGKS
jgi:hypothetical protein